jgi:hypothetical protein
MKQAWFSVVAWTTLQSTLITLSYAVILWRVLLQRAQLAGTRFSVNLYLARAAATQFWLLWPGNLCLAAAWLAVVCVHSQYAHRKRSVPLRVLTLLPWPLVASGAFLALAQVDDPVPVLSAGLYSALLLYLVWWLLLGRRRFHRMAAARARTRTRTRGWCCRHYWCRPLRASICLLTIVLFGVSHLALLLIFLPRRATADAAREKNASLWMLTCTCDTMICAYLWLTDLGFIARILAALHRNRSLRSLAARTGYGGRDFASCSGSSGVHVDSVEDAYAYSDSTNDDEEYRRLSSLLG